MKRKILALSVVLLVMLVTFLVGCDENNLGHTVIYGREDSTYGIISIDELTGGMVTLEDIHAEIHEGHCFYSYDVTELGSTGNRTILIRTDSTAGTSTHFYWEVDMELESRIEIFEGGTYSAVGVAMPIYNRNRNSAITSGTTMYHTPTISTLGTLVLEKQLGSGKKAGGIDSPLNELMLKTDTVYFMRITNQTVSDSVVSGRMIWYEPD